jgi:hypothetical protein
MKEKQKLIALIALLGVGVLIWRYNWNRQADSSQSFATLEHYQLLAEQNPQIRWDILRDAQGTEYKTNGRNPFSTIKPPTAQEIQNNAAALVAQNTHKGPYGPMPPPPPPPPAPVTLPANLKYFGYGTVPNGSPRRAFFTDGEDVYIVPEGEVLLGRYRILKVGNTNLEFQEISSGRTGSVPLEEAPPAPNA